MITFLKSPVYVVTYKLMGSTAQSLQVMYKLKFMQFI